MTGNGPPRGEGRQALIEATVRIVARDGLDKLSVRAAAIEAGVTPGLATYHFGSRESMVAEALEWETERSIQLSKLGPDGGSLEELAGDLPGLIARDPEGAAFQFAMALAGRQRPELNRRVRDLYDRYCKVVRDALQDAGVASDDTLARVVFAAIDGLVLQQLVHGDEQATQAGLDRLRDLLAALED